MQTRSTQRSSEGALIAPGAFWCVALRGDPTVEGVDEADRRRTRRPTQEAPPRQRAQDLAEARAASREGAVVLSRLPGPAGRRGNRPAPADTAWAALTPGPFPLLQDHRRLQFHVPVHLASRTARVRACA